MFSVITNIYNKKTKGPTLMELFTATGKLKKFFFRQLEIFDVCTTGNTAHIETIFKLLLHTLQHVPFLENKRQHFRNGSKRKEIWRLFWELTNVKKY